MENRSSFQHFGGSDYAVFGFTVTASLAVGLFFALFNKGQQSILNYVLANKNMPVYPIVFSIMAEAMTPFTILVRPVEVYNYGAAICITVVANFLAHVFVAIVYIPVFCNMNVISAYEYLNRRFNPGLRTFFSICFVLQSLVTQPLILYLTALGIAQATGFGLQTVISTVTITCLFYTTLGGAKAIIWTDTIQVTIMLFATLTLMIVGTDKAGGIGNVWEKNIEGERIEFFDMSLNLFARNSFWNVLFGYFFFICSIRTTSQGTIQRCLSVKTTKDAKTAIIASAIGQALYVFGAYFIGLVIYATFAECDPLTAKEIRKPDQLVIYYMMTVVNNVPVLPALFLAAIASAGLSTLSTVYNSVACVICQDFVRPMWRGPISEATSIRVMKIIVVLFGVITLCTAGFIDKMGTLFQLTISVYSTISPALFGIITLGMLFPWANAKGAWCGGMASIVLVVWLTLGQQFALINKQIVYPMKPMSMDICDNDTMALYQEKLLDMPNASANISNNQGEPFVLYEISYVLFPLIGAVTAIVIGMAISWCTGFSDVEEADPILFSPVIYSFLPKGRTKTSLLVDDEQPGLSSRPTEPLFEQLLLSESALFSLDQNDEKS